MNLTGSSLNSPKRGKKGFALILTLALISFVFLLVITLVNQVRMEFSFTESRQNQILAKAHARMGMMIAIGEIQKHLGPDTRVNATADIYDERLSFSENSSSVDLNEDGVVNTIPLGQRMWTGVWKNRGGWAETKLATRPLPENRDDGKALTLSWSYDSSYDPHPAVESAWLVSGNEGWKKKLAVLSSNNVVREFVEVPDGIIIDDEGARVLNQPRGDTYGQAENPWADHKLIVEDVNRSNAYYHPLLSVAEDEQRAWLLKYPVLGEDFDPQNPAHQNNWEQYLVGEPVAVPKTAIHDADDTESGLAQNQAQDWEGRKGSYAYWVADEGVKAKINISVPELTNETKLKVASSPNIGEGSFGINLTPQKEEKRKDLLTIDSLSSLLEVDKTQFKSNSYHSMTADSFGVLTDVRTGGLKRDLSLAFSLDQVDGEAWRKDFESNFLFRDRVRALKNIPLSANAKRNEWYVSAGDASVDDADALLAGAPWSVLADFHNTDLVDEKLMMKAPDQFPRTVGDNALIFGRTAPKSPRGAFSRASAAYPYYNCFSSSVRKIRPEPKNHSIFPIVTKFKFSVCPVATEVSGQPNKGEFSLALSPAVTLWNPYNHEMVLDDLHLEVPFGNMHGHPGGTTTSRFSGLDLKEYDLYRKWWAYLYDVNNTDNLNISNLSESGKLFSGGKVKNKWEPWGLYEFVRGKILKTESSGPIDFIQNIYIKEPGLWLGLKEQTYAPTQPNKSYFNLDSNINKSNWDARITPDSLFGIKLVGKELYHEAPREGGGNYVFRFTTVTGGEVGMKRMVVRISSSDHNSSQVTLLPGEVATFAVFKEANDLDEVVLNNETVTLDLYKWQDDAVERASLLKSGFEIYAQTPESVSLFLESNSFGIAGYVSTTKNNKQQMPAEKFNPNGSLSELTWPSDSEFYSPVCLTLWQGHPDGDNSKCITKWTSSFIPGGGDFESGLAYDSYSSVSYLKSNLDKIKTTSSRNLMIGFGWSAQISSPGGSANERIQLVEFNNRALVHSNQHGQGQLFDSSSKYSAENYFDNDGALYDAGGSAFNYDIQPEIDDFYRQQFSYEVNGKTFVFNNSNSDYKPESPKSFPDVFSLPNIADQPIPVGFNTTEDVMARASLLNFNPTNKINSGIPIFPVSKNPDFKAPNVPASIGQDRVGFFANKRTSNAPYSGKFSDSNRAVLYEIPKGKILSILQYKHANLNNYIHGPSYTLGNSYASTQVARHRSWGRLQNIESKPTSEQGLLNLVQNSNNRKSVSDYYDSVLGPGAFPDQTLQNDWAWTDNTIDFSLGFGAWRSGQNNYQNTTVDHSYYLNRALLDGFFLSGSSDVTDYNEEDLSTMGEKFRPYLWLPENGMPFNFSKEIELEGNHRLIGYFRDNIWEDANSSYGNKSRQRGLSQKNDSEYRYQTSAGDILLDGAFNINSTSKDAWAAQLSSLRGVPVYKKAPSPLEPYNVNSKDSTPIVRFFTEPMLNGGPNSFWENSWNEFRKLNDEEINILAEAMVKQVKLRGPFLSLADFVNRRLALGPMEKTGDKAKGTRINFVQYDLNEWTKFPEDRYSAQGLRGAVQSAIAEAGLNDDDSETWVTDSWIPKIPNFRYDLVSRYFYDSSFGLHASALNLDRNFLNPVGGNDNNGDSEKKFGSGTTKIFKDKTAPTLNGGPVSIRVHKEVYNSTAFGEAPENLLSVEHLATGANKPGWVMQSDLLSPLIPVTSARSDTFVIRVQGDTNSRSPANAWIELVVQRTPDYVKPDLDAPHHRPHEPFKDINLNGFWDNGRGEHWIDLNQNADVFDQPDLPGVGELGKQKDYRDGLLSDLKLNMDPQEEDIESQSQISYLGTNQRFGRKFKIVRFRWLRANEV